VVVLVLLKSSLVLIDIYAILEGDKTPSFL